MKVNYEYVWQDAEGNFRSKVKIAEVNNDRAFPAASAWGFDGSSTDQASTRDSDCILVPIREYRKQHRLGPILVLCEVRNANGDPFDPSRNFIERFGSFNDFTHIIDLTYLKEQIMLGFEQEYFFKESPKEDAYIDGFSYLLNGPSGEYSWVYKGDWSIKQGDFYCGVALADPLQKRIVEEHAQACIDFGISIEGTNQEVAPSQWEYQIGGPAAEDALRVCDDLMMSRYLLVKIAASHGKGISFVQKPLSGDWNGSGLHTNFSTAKTRVTGQVKIDGIPEEIYNIIDRLAQPENIQAHLDTYGEGIQERLTGKHETAPWNVFSCGIASRKDSVRIPRHVAEAGFGYFEDRRPGANANPYHILKAFLETIYG